jgi:hypothetical protein
MGNLKKEKKNYRRNEILWCGWRSWDFKLWSIESDQGPNFVGKHCCMLDSCVVFMLLWKCHVFNYLYLCDFDPKVGKKISTY